MLYISHHHNFVDPISWPNLVAQFHAECACVKLHNYSWIMCPIKCRFNKYSVKEKLEQPNVNTFLYKSPCEYNESLFYFRSKNKSFICVKQ